MDYVHLFLCFKTELAISSSSAVFLFFQHTVLDICVFTIKMVSTVVFCIFFLVNLMSQLATGELIEEEERPCQ